MLTTGSQIPFPGQRKGAARRRIGANGLMLASYFAYFTVALLIFSAMIISSLLP